MCVLICLTSVYIGPRPTLRNWAQGFSRIKSKINSASALRCNSYFYADLLGGSSVLCFSETEWSGRIWKQKRNFWRPLRCCSSNDNCTQIVSQWELFSQTLMEGEHQFLDNTFCTSVMWGDSLTRVMSWFGERWWQDKERPLLPSQT